MPPRTRIIALAVAARNRHQSGQAQKEQVYGKPSERSRVRGQRKTAAQLTPDLLGNLLHSRHDCNNVKRILLRKPASITAFRLPSSRRLGSAWIDRMFPLKPYKTSEGVFSRDCVLADNASEHLEVIWL